MGYWLTGVMSTRLLYRSWLERVPSTKWNLCCLITTKVVFVHSLCFARFFPTGQAILQVSSSKINRHTLLKHRPLLLGDGGIAKHTWIQWTSFNRWYVPKGFFVYVNLIDGYVMHLWKQAELYIRVSALHLCLSMWLVIIKYSFFFSEKMQLNNTIWF